MMLALASIDIVVLHAHFPFHLWMPNCQPKPIWYDRNTWKLNLCRLYIENIQSITYSIFDELLKAIHFQLAYPIPILSILYQKASEQKQSTEITMCGWAKWSKLRWQSHLVSLWVLQSSKWCIDTIFVWSRHLLYIGKNCIVEYHSDDLLKFTWINQ